MGKKLATTAPQGTVTAEGGEVARRPRRRWRRRLAVGAVVVLVVSLVLYGWAWSSVDRSTISPRSGAALAFPDWPLMDGQLMDGQLVDGEFVDWFVVDRQLMDGQLLDLRLSSGR